MYQQSVYIILLSFHHSQKRVTSLLVAVVFAVFHSSRIEFTLGIGCLF